MLVAYIDWHLHAFGCLSDMIFWQGLKDFAVDQLYALRLVM